MAWPSPADYVEALQSTRVCLVDPELQLATPEPDSLGLPRPRCGNFAAVFRLRGARSDWALRCFLRDEAERDTRYSIIDGYVKTTRLHWFVPFSYLKKGIRVRGITYPVLKMEWANGEHLDSFLKKGKASPAQILGIAGEFETLVRELRANSIAHGDLQHGNLLVVDGHLRLVDYDGMFVPGLEALPSHEIGHRNYQHPARSSAQFGPDLDNFSAWVIYTSLVCLAAYPGSWRVPGVLDECLLFRRSDFEHPETSTAFQALQRSTDPRVIRLESFLESLAYCDGDSVPPLDPAAVPPPPMRPMLASSLPEWVRAHPSYTSASQPGKPWPLEGLDLQGGASWVHGHLALPPRTRFAGPFKLERLVAWGTVCAFVATLSVGLVTLAGALSSASAARPDQATLASLGLVAAALLTLEPSALAAFLYIRYRTRPEVRAKRLLAAELRKVWVTAAAHKKKAEKLAATVSTARQSEVVGAREHDESKARLMTDARNEMDAIGRQLQLVLGSIAARTRALAAEEEAATTKELVAHQVSFLRTQLSSYRVATAQIRGFGLVLITRLEQAGIRTAADVAGMRQVTSGWGQYQNQVTYISLADGRSVHVEGLGPKKAEALLAWRNQLEANARPTLPRILPADRAKALSTQFQRLKADLALQKATAETAAQSARTATSQKHTRLTQELEKAYALKKQDRANQTQKALEALRQNRSDFARSRWDYSGLQRSRTTYSQITFGQFVRLSFWR